MWDVMDMIPLLICCAQPNQNNGAFAVYVHFTFETNFHITDMKLVTNKNRPAIGLVDYFVVCVCTVKAFLVWDFLGCDNTQGGRNQYHFRGAQYIKKIIGLDVTKH